MCEAINRIYNSGVEEGKKEGEEKLGNLIKKLLDAGHIEDAAKAATNKQYRQTLYAEYQIP
ncbi:MAG: hypothetical protein IJ242_10515, partial [Clostridia bacterium]|nr:hypothetical protein [Clostridia bacterium]